MNLYRLSPSAQKLMMAAANESNQRGHHFLGVEHVFLALAASDRTSLARVLAEQKVKVPQFCESLADSIAVCEHPPWGSEIVCSPRCREVLRIAGGVASRRGSHLIDDIHILEAMLFEGNSEPIHRLRDAGVSIADLHDAVIEEASGKKEQETPILNQLGRDLTAEAASGRLLPVVGRETEIGLLAQVMLRKNKNNPVLVGEAGVGKTAVVEGLAQTLVSDGCPPAFRGCRIIELSVASLIAGTKYRGDFEQRLLDVLREASSSRNLILFLDEIHTLMGAGASAGEGLDASNMFKPSLARGEIRCIGATTIDEYRRYIETDAALERRFEKILVEEPDMEKAREILAGVAPALEEHHELSISSSALDAALELTVRYVPNRRLPDKAIDAIDQACARVRLNAPALPDGGGETALEIGSEAVARTVAQWTGIPLERISGDDARNLLGLEEQLGRRVIGQDRAVQAVSRAMLTARAGFSDPHRPAGVFLFVGPTGVGKTELARSLAEIFFGDEKRLLRFDMSEYTEAHSVARLIGAPPGYVGHDREGLLISSIRTHPHSVVLFDEVEKAHPQIFDLFLQVFDEGRLTSTRGVQADFRQAIIILTSNIDPRPVREKHVGFVEDGAAAVVDPDVRATLMAWFRPELINRFDDVVKFDPLAREHLKLILERYVDGIQELGADRGLRLELDEGVKEFLIERGDPGRFGARELRRVVDRYLRQPLARELLRRGEEPGTLRVFVEDQELRLA